MCVCCAFARVLGWSKQVKRTTTENDKLLNLTREKKKVKGRAGVWLWCVYRVPRIPEIRLSIDLRTSTKAITL